MNSNVFLKLITVSLIITLSLSISFTDNTVKLIDHNESILLIEGQSHIPDIPSYLNVSNERTFFNTVSNVSTTSSAFDLTVIEDHLIVADGINGVKILNISDPTNPVMVGSVSTGGDVRVVGPYLEGPSDISFAESNFSSSLFNAGWGKISISGVANITDPVLETKIENGNFTKEKFHFSTKLEEIYAVEDDTFYFIGPSYTLGYNITETGIGFQTVSTFLDEFGTQFIAFSTESQGLVIYEPPTGNNFGSFPPDLMNPSDPNNGFIESNEGFTIGSGGPIFNFDTHIVKADQTDGLIVYQTSDADNFQRIKVHNQITGVQDLIVYQNYLITAHGDSGIKIWDGVDPTQNFTLIDEIDSSGSAVSLEIFENHLYVADSTSVVVFKLDPYSTDIELDKELKTYQNLGITTLLPEGAHYVTDIEFDQSGNMYIIGNYDAINYDFTSSPYFTESGSFNDPHEEMGFIIVFDNNGQLLYGNTIELGINDTRYMDIEITDEGNIIILTYNKPLTNEVGNNPKHGADDYLFVLNFTSSFVLSSSIEIYTPGYDLVGQPKLGTSFENETIHDELLAVAPDGSIYVAFNSDQEFDSAFPPIVAKPSSPGQFHTALVKINTSNQVEWTTWWGAGSFSYAGGIAVDHNYIYVTGITEGGEFSINPPLDKTYGQRIVDVQRSPFVTLFNPDGSYEVYTSWDSGEFVEVEDIELDYNGDIVIAGFDNQTSYTSPKDGVRGSNGNSHFGDLTNLNGSGFIIRLNTHDFETLQYLRTGAETTIYNSRIYDVELRQNLVFFSADYAFRSGDYTSSFVWRDEGYFAPTPTPSDPSNPAVGIFNSTGDLVLSYLITKNDTNDSPYTDRFPLGLATESTELYVILDNMQYDDSGTVSSGAELFRFDYNDTDGDGLADYTESNIYDSNPFLWDTDDDNLLDSHEVYVYGTNPSNSDTDFDCLFDGVEIELGFNPLINDASADDDGDGLPIWEEHLYGTDFNQEDTDGDGLTDYEEVKIYFTNPVNSDPDGDGLADGFEILTHGTDPHKNDSDGDRLSDFYEVNTGYSIEVNGILVGGSFNPLLADEDEDGLNDFQEILFNTLPWDNDTDDDMISDYDEAILYFSTANHIDYDMDALNDTAELFIWFTNSTNDDSDGDGLNDYAEVIVEGTDPWDTDTDDDGLTDGMEISLLIFDPLVADNDTDGLLDGDEALFGGNPNDNDTDDDGILDGVEVELGLNLQINQNTDDLDEDGITTQLEYFNYSTHPLNPDTDSDGLNDGYEINNDLNPLNFDTDDDGLNDGEEVLLLFTDPLLQDTDNDGLSDKFEIQEFFTNPLLNDTDDDGLVDGIEFGISSNPFNNDTDSDGLYDLEEYSIYFTSLLTNDTDGDELLDYEEINTHNTNPSEEDSDFDGLDDKSEFDNNANPNDEDSDDDLLLDGEEVLTWNTNPNDNDTDSDTLSDYYEVTELNSDPNSIDTDSDGMGDLYESEFDLKINQNDADEDPDGDNLTNIEEFNLGTYPNNPDTDGDEIRDDLDSDPLNPEGSTQIETDQPLGERIQNGISEEPGFAAGAGIALFGALVTFIYSFYQKRKSGFGGLEG